MSLFSEQIDKRKKLDDAIFEEAFYGIAGSVMGRRISMSLRDERLVTKDALEEILKYLRIPFGDIPPHLKSTEEILDHLLRPYGIQQRPVKLTKGWRKDASSVMLGTLKEGNVPIALIPNAMGVYGFKDPVTGERKKVDRRTEGEIDEDALVFYRPFPLKKLTIKELFLYICSNIMPGDVLIYLVMSLVITLVGMLTPFFTKRLFSDVVSSGSMVLLGGISVFLLCSSVSLMMYQAFRQLVLSKVKLRLDQQVEAATMMRILSLPVSFFRDYSSGELSSRIEHMSSLVEQLLGMGADSLISGLFSLMYIGQMVCYAPALTGTAITVTLITLIITVMSAVFGAKISRKIMEETAKENAIAYSFISGIQKIKLSGAEKRAFSKWGEQYARVASLVYNPPALLKLNMVILMAVDLAGTMIIYFLSVKNGVTVSEYYAFNSAYAMQSAAFASLAAVVTTVSGVIPTFQMVKPILDAVPENDAKKPVIEKLSGGVELSHVTFGYDREAPPVLNDISIKIRPGQYVAIVGSTGCGKSTLMRLLLGFEKPWKGAIYYDGVDIEKVDLKSLRKNIGVVMQNGRLFSGDIYSNIVISAPHLTLDDAWEAASLAGMADDIRDMPMGMHTIISEGSGGISGGQRQRIMIARAIAPKPKILMFDEATSALDNITQKKVSQSLDELKCTRLVIAHRLSTIRQCDRIIVLENGRITEDGSFDELISAGGFFKKLVERQRLDDDGYVGLTTAF